MPAEGLDFLPGEHLLTFEEIEQFVRVCAELGVRRLRLTGGEPLVRPHLEQLVGKLSAIPGIEDLALTTNGIFLANRAQALKDAGVTRINISLDSLRPERFAQITRGGDLNAVLRGLDRSFEVGFDPIKINVVLMKGFNEDEIDDFLRLSIDRPVTVRFIEYMPIGHEGADWKASYLPLEHVLERCQANGWEARPLTGKELLKGNGPAENFKIPGSQGAFGLIHPVSDHFCGSCNRLRLTADGHIKPCLYWDEEFNIRRAHGDPEQLKQLVYRALDAKPETHEMAKALAGEDRSQAPTTRRMSQIGG